jgi:hypothetical protein
MLTDDLLEAVAESDGELRVEKPKNLRVHPAFVVIGHSDDRSHVILNRNKPRKNLRERARACKRLEV